MPLNAHNIIYRVCAWKLGGVGVDTLATVWLLLIFYLFAPMGTQTGSANLRPLKISWDPENKWLIMFHGTRSDGDHRTFAKSFARWEGSGCGSNLSPLHCVPTTNIPLQICFLCSAFNSALIFPPYDSAIFRNSSLLFRHIPPFDPPFSTIIIPP